MTRLNFDRIAPFYNFLAALVFGKAISASQQIFPERCSTAKRILVLGGGTGNFLPSLRLISGATIDFIDSSSEMLRRAQSKRVKGVVFIHGTEESIPADSLYDVVITFFYLDLFNDIRLDSVIRQVDKFLAPAAIWVAADFVDEGKWWQRKLLSVMYFFFRVTCGVTISSLPDWKAALHRHGFRPGLSNSFKGGFIQTVSCNKSLLHP